MSYVVSRHGSNLLVAAEAADERAIAHALAQIPHPNGRLILDIDHNEEYRCLEHKVRLKLSTGEAPFVCSWRDDDGRPLPLSFALVEQVKQLMSGRGDSFKEAQEHNQRLRDRARQEMGDEIEAIAADMVPFIQGRRSSTLRRGVHLRRSRARREEQAAEAARQQWEQARRDRHNQRRIREGKEPV